MDMRDMVAAVEREIEAEMSIQRSAPAVSYTRLERLADLKQSLTSYKLLSYSQWMLLSQCIDNNKE